MDFGKRRISVENRFIISKAYYIQVLFLSPLVPFFSLSSLFWNDASLMEYTIRVPRLKVAYHPT